MKISIIAAIDRNRALGFNNRLLFRLPNDMKRFKALTTGHTVVMGRNTYHSLPKGALPNRRNIVLSKTESNFPGCDHYESLDEALRHCTDNEELYIIGGARLYESALNIADRLCLTEIDAEAKQADTWFPDYSGWKETSRQHNCKDERHAYDYDFVDYVRKS